MRRMRGGAAPAADLLQKAGRLTRHQRGILDVLIDNPEGLDVATLSRATEAHPNTVRGHLAALASRGLISSQKREDGLKGRPAFVYRATTTVPESSARHLVALLHSALEVMPADRREDEAYRWGRAWGARMAADLQPGEDLTTHLMTLMTEMGFAPQLVPGRIDLFRCPLMSSAGELAAGICRIHQGMMDELAARKGVVPSPIVVPAATASTCQILFGETG